MVNYMGKSLISFPFKTRYFYKNIPYLFRSIKWFFIRGKNGWSEYDVWNMDGYLLKIIPEMLRHLADHHFGYPSNIANIRDEQYDKGKDEEWTQKLLEIAHHFEEADFDNCSKAQDYLDKKISYIDLDKYCSEQLHLGMVELERYFYNLWD